MAVIPSDNTDNKISASRLVIYDRDDMVKVFKSKNDRNPTNETDLLSGLTKSDFNSLTKHYSLGDFVKYTTESKCTKDNDYFCGDMNDKDTCLNYKLYMQGGCTDGTNLYYLLNQKEPYVKSSLIKVACGTIRDSENNDETTKVYYINKNYVKVIHLTKYENDSDYNDVLHGQDMTYVPNLPIYKNNLLSSVGAILICNHHLILVINPITMEIYNNILYLKGLFDYYPKNAENYTPCQRISLQQPSLWKDVTINDKTYNFKDMYSISGISYNKISELLVVNYAICGARQYGFYKIKTNYIVWEDDNQYIEVVPENYTKNNTSYYEDIPYTVDGCETIGGITSYNRLIFQTRTDKESEYNNSKFFKNIIYQLNPQMNDEMIEKYFLKRSLELTSAISSSGVANYVYYEVENICIKKKSIGIVQVFVGYKEFVDYVENRTNPPTKPANIICFEYNIVD